MNYKCDIHIAMHLYNFLAPVPILAVSESLTVLLWENKLLTKVPPLCTIHIAVILTYFFLGQHFLLHIL